MSAWPTAPVGGQLLDLAFVVLEALVRWLFLSLGCLSSERAVSASELAQCRGTWLLHTSQLS